MRQWIYKALCAVVIDHKYSNLYLKDHLKEVDKKDRALASRIFYGTLQNYEYCFQAWKRFAKGKVDKKAAVLLTMSAYQLIFMDRVPAYAVIDDANKIAARHFPRLKGLVNAILRKVSDEPLELPAHPLEAIALEYSLPLWLVKMWDAQYGLDLARQFAASSVATHPVFVRPNPLKPIPQEVFEKDNPRLLPEQLVEEVQLPHGTDLFLYDGENIAGDPLYKNGQISVQDPGSYEIACFVDPKKGESVLDLCAAPGTKTLAMAERMENKGSIDALDLHEHRAKLIETDAKRLGIDIVHAKAQDSTNLDGFGLYDKVLCDVPCSGYGVLGRKPDMKLTIKPEDMDSLIPVQARLLESGAEHVKEGGWLVYSTCTMNKKENEKQVDAFLKKHPEFELKESRSVLPDEMHDGFYMAALERRGAIDEGQNEPIQ